MEDEIEKIETKNNTSVPKYKTFFKKKKIVLFYKIIF